MARWTWLLLCLLFPIPTAWAQDDDGGIEIEVGEPGDQIPEDEESKKTKKPAKPPTFPRRKPGQRVETKRHRDATKKHSLELPVDWVLHPIDDARAVLAWEVTLPGTKGISRLDVRESEEMGAPRGALYYFRKSAVDSVQKDAASEIRAEPIPQVLVTVERGEAKWTTTFAFLRVRGHGYIARFEFPHAEFAVAHADFERAMESFEADVALFPAIPSNYIQTTKGRYLFAEHPTVKGEWKGIEKIMRKAEKRFTKMHGKLPRPVKGDPIVVYVHANKTQAGKIMKEAADSQVNFHRDVTNLRLFTVPVDRKNLNEASWLAAETHGLLFVLKYGQPNPGWVDMGERTVARAEVLTGRSLPSLNTGMVAWSDKTRFGPLDQLPEARKAENTEPWFFQSFFYVCMFRAGPSKYRKAYKGFLAEFAKTADWEAALQKHLLSLELHDVRQEAQDFMWNKLKPVKPDD